MSHYKGKSEIVKILMDRDNMMQNEAEEKLRAARLEVAMGANPETVLFENFGLEPDYVFELI